MRAWLLDTGPLVAYLDAAEEDHEAVAARLDAFTGQLFTTSAVITEAMHFVSEDHRGPVMLAEFVARSGLQVLDFSDAAHLAEAARRMEKYRNVPMDYADATIVLLAERLGLFELLNARPSRLLRFPLGSGQALFTGAGPALTLNLPVEDLHTACTPGAVQSRVVQLSS